MSKVWSVARAEYRNAVQSKAFIIGVILMPVFMCGAMLVQAFMKDKVDIKDRKFAIVDRTGQLAQTLVDKSEERNQWIYDPEEPGKQIQPKFVTEVVKAEKSPTTAQKDELQLELSDRVRKGDLFAFVIIGADTIDPEKADVKGADNKITYHTQTPTFRKLPNWIHDELNDKIRDQRFEAAGKDQKEFKELNRAPAFERQGLFDKENKEAKKENDLQTFGVPAGAMFFLFMMVMMSAPAMLNAVLEEKMQKISEILISSVTPFQLMLGKLVATVLIALTLSALYVGALIIVLNHYDVLHTVPVAMYFWFFLFQLLALIMFGSIFIGIGAACSEIRDAQSLMMPAMLLVLIPLFCWIVVLESPSSTFSRVISLIPPATPMLMLLRIGIPPGPPWWEIALSVVLTSLFALACVAAAGKVFRIGILSQGQAPSVAKLIRWVFSK